MSNVRWVVLGLGLVCLAGVENAATLRADEPTIFSDTLPRTELLEMDEPLHAVMVRQISGFAEAELLRVQTNRTAPWLPHNGEAPTMSREQALELLRELIGAVDPVVEQPVVYAKELSATDAQRVDAIRWDVLEGITGDGLAVVNKTPSAERDLLIFLGDADQSPEALVGWGTETVTESELLRSFAGRDDDVYVPRLINRASYASGHPDIRWTNLSHREFVYRTGFEMGRHVIGYEVQRVLALARALRAEFPERRIKLLGVGEGGLLALYAGALGQEFDQVIVRGYFGPHQQVWEEPLDRNIWRGQEVFGNAELAALILPRKVIIDPTLAPEVSGPPAPGPGMGDIAAPGKIVSPSREEVLQEFERAVAYLAAAGAAGDLKLFEIPIAAHSLRVDEPAGLDVAARVEEHQRQQIRELVMHTQALLHRSDKQRDKLWQGADRSSLESWAKTAPAYRDRMHDELIGRLPVADVAAMHPRSRLVLDEATHVGYEVVLDVYTGEYGVTNFIAGGILLVPKGLQAGEQRPVVVCQHGLEGTPMDTIVTDPADRSFAPYKGFSTQLVQRGFIVYVPQNPYKGYHDFRVIQRKSNPLGRSLFSYIIEQHRQSLQWLATLPVVDAERIAFYGLSYGGKTAVRVPPLLVDATADGEQEPLYCLSICSADYDDWIRKNCSAEDRYSYVFTPEYEIFEWNMGHLANYAELANLMTPRPFMVERGHHDGVAPDEWVAWEYAKVQRHYVQLGIGDRAEIEWFNGPHTINGQGTFRFLHRHLNWPSPEQ